MPVEIRPISIAELEEYVRLDAYAFGYPVTAEVLEWYRTSYRPEWTLAAFADGRMTAHLVTFPWRMALNGGTAPLGAIADVAARPEDRRRGYTGALLRACLARMRDQGLALSMLYPTFYALYRRFGWAQAAAVRDYTFRPADLRFLGAAAVSGRVERLPPADSRLPLMAVYERTLPHANGAVPRAADHWDARTFKRRPGTPGLHAVLWRGASGEPEGYIIHREPTRLAAGLAAYDQEITVRELVAGTPAAYRGLLDYLAHHDLAGRITWSAPPDDPLPALLADPKAVQVELRPSFMLRVVDLVPALEARAYLPGPPARLVLRVADAAAPWNEGTWLLTVAEGRARVTPAAGEPEISTDAGTLAALYNGFLTPAQALHGGLLVVQDASALAAATRVFAVTRPPYCLDYF